MVLFEGIGGHGGLWLQIFSGLGDRAMGEFSDYDLENAVRILAAQLQIVGCSRKTPEELFSQIETCCPLAAQVFLERTFEKDKLRDCIKNLSGYPLKNGDIVSDGDLEIENGWIKLTELYPALIDAVKECKK